MGLLEVLNEIFTHEHMLLVVDVQRSLRNMMTNYDACVDYIRKHKNDYDSIVATVLVNNDMMSRGFIAKTQKLKLPSDHDAEDDIEFPYTEISTHAAYTLDLLSSFNTSCYNKITVIGNNNLGCLYTITAQIVDADIEINFIKELVDHKNLRDRRIYFYLLNKLFDKEIFDEQTQNK